MVRERSPLITLEESCQGLLNLGKPNNKNMLCNLECFNRKRNFSMNLLGTHIVDKFVKTAQGYKDAEGEEEKS